MVADMLKVYIGNVGHSRYETAVAGDREVAYHSGTVCSSINSGGQAETTCRENGDIPDRAWRIEPGTGCCLTVSAKHYPDAG
jgi:hypothetical protein